MVAETEDEPCWWVWEYHHAKPTVCNCCPGQGTGSFSWNGVLGASVSLGVYYTMRLGSGVRRVWTCFNTGCPGFELSFPVLFLGVFSGGRQMDVLLFLLVVSFGSFVF